MNYLDPNKLLERCGIDSRPSYFYGRGAKRSDVSPENLYKMFQIIYEKYGKEIAENFHNMILDIKELSAINLIFATRELAKHDWIYKKEKFSPEGSPLEGSTSRTREAIGFGAIATSLQKYGDDTDYIKNHFKVLVKKKTIIPLKGLIFSLIGILFIKIMSPITGLIPILILMGGTLLNKIILNWMTSIYRMNVGNMYLIFLMQLMIPASIVFFLDGPKVLLLLISYYVTLGVIEKIFKKYERS